MIRDTTRDSIRLIGMNDLQYNSDFKNYAYTFFFSFFMLQFLYFLPFVNKTYLSPIQKRKKKKQIKDY